MTWREEDSSSSCVLTKNEDPGKKASTSFLIPPVCHRHTAQLFPEEEEGGRRGERKWKEGGIERGVAGVSS